MQERPVLVIDNDAEAIKLITDTLQPLGYSVISASTGQEGLDAAKTKSPLLIFINLAVPDTEGLKICKSFMSIIDSPMILLTLREGKYDPRYKSQYGIVDFLKKPIDPHDMVKKVNEFAPLEEVEEEAVAMEAEEAEPLELAEEEAPSAAELAASVASYAEVEEPITPAEEEIEAVEVLSDEEVVEAAEVVEAIPEEEVVEIEEAEAEEEVGEWAIPEEEAGAAAEEEVGEWAIPGEEAVAEEEAPSWEMPEAETEAAAEEAPEWSIPEEEAPAFEETPPAEEEAPTVEETPLEEVSAEEEMDWGELGEEKFEEPAMPEEAPEGEELFGEEPVEQPPIHEEEPFALDEEEPYELPSEEEEYEVRPAALERAKRRKSRPGILIPLLVLLLVGAIAGGVYFFFFAGKGMVSKPEPKKPAPTVAKKVEPAPALAKPVTRAPKPAPSKPAPSVKRPAPAKTAAERTYYVQFGAFRSRGNAVKFQKNLKTAGYETIIKELTVKDQPLYLVLLSTPFTDKWTAFKQARQIKETSDIGTAVHME